MKKNHLELTSFHDNFVHTISFADEKFSSDFILDIDYIKEWKCIGVHPEFNISPANLVFRMVNSLAISISKSDYTINSYLGIILNITSKKLTETRRKYNIEMVDGDCISLEAAHVELQVTNRSILTVHQYLINEERNLLIANKDPAVDYELYSIE